MNEASRWKSLALLTFIFFVLSATRLNAEQKKPVSAPTKKTGDLIWPLPPDKPRIKYLTSVSSSLDVEPPKKKGWLQKVINEETHQTVLGLMRPSGIAVDSKDRIYIADTNKGAVFVFDLAAKSMALLGNDGRGRLGQPFGIVIDNKDNVYVSDTGLKAVNIYDPQWSLTASLKQVGNETLVNPTGLALDEPRNRLLIVDSRGHKVFVADLAHLGQGTAFGKRGEEDNEFNFPSYVAADKDGKIYVTDTLNFSVKIYDKDFKFLKRIGEHGNGLGMFDRPKGVTLDSEGNLYVVDMSFSNFQIFNPKGKLLMFLGGFGNEPGFFRMPSGIFIDKKNRIYVSDQANKRVQIFQFLGGS